VRGKGGERTGERTYGIWGFVAFFTLLCLIGVLLLVFGGGSGSGTTQVPTRQTLPEAAGTGSTTSVDDGSATDGGTDGGTDGTTPSGAALPDGVTSVLSEGGTTSWAFRPPAGADTTSLEPVVAPTTVRIGADDRSATLTIGCARSAEEFLAQVVVTEGEQSVTFAAIAVVPPDSAPCAAGAAPRTVEIELVEPMAGRSVVVVPAGSTVPALEPA
jgi:hypothetical protein